MNSHAKSLLIYLLKTRNFKDPELALIKTIANSLVDSEQTKAFATLNDLFDQGRKSNVEIASVLSICLYYGVGVEEDNTAFIALAYIADQSENLMCRFMISLSLLESPAIEKNEKGIAYLQLLAEKGYPPAQTLLGNCYARGENVKKDIKKAIELYAPAANQGYAEAQYILGNCYDDGDGVEKDFKKAAECFALAANQGHAEAQYMLGECYYNGDGVDIDLKKAAEWFGRAASQGYAPAQYMLGNCHYYGHGIEKDFKKAAESFALAANQNYAYAQNNLAFCYYLGNGVHENLETALGLFFSSADLGNQNAINFLRKKAINISDTSFAKKFQPNSVKK